ncbi:MAG: filamentous hemagglutinin N-terminal domain-containing protein, partial [Rhodocyclaceae bacterium]|nr:filamentous hemagglutinin N-terminal domain-containing protein [Rhodocyclaceae bacterium]
MNKIYRIVWNEALHTWQAVAEIAPSRGKPASGGTGGRRRRHLAILAAAAATGLPLPGWAAPGANELPAGGQTVAGQAAIRQSGATMNIDQASQRAVIDWSSYNVGSAATVNYRQPSASSVTLNRVTGADPSQIFGRINANGQVYLSNPNGVYFAPGASVNVGALVATTHTISLEDFLAGRARFERNGATGSVVNEGELRATLGGYIALLAPEVRNQGLIVANLGGAALAAGDSIELQFDSNNALAGVHVSPSTLKALVDNRSAVLAPGGLVILSARAMDGLQGSVVNSGAISASSLVEKGGRILLEGDDITLKSGTTLTATGASGGGEVLVGGDWQGSGDMHQATRVSMNAGATIDVSATQAGDGGKAVLWSQVSNPGSVTSVHGSITANAGAYGGDGGRIETSGHLLNIDGVSGGASAAHGKSGLWLFDPTNVTIGASGSSASAAVDGSSTLTASSISGLLSGGTSVTVTTFSGGSDLGDLTVNSAITKSSGAGDVTLTLRAANSIVINSDITHGGGSGKLNLAFDADNDTAAATSSSSPSRDGGGIVILGSNLSTGGGSLTFGGTASSGFTGGDLYIGGGSNAIALTTSGGAVNIKGQLLIATSNAAGVTVSTSGGNISVGGSVDSGNSYAAVAGTWTWDQATADAPNAANSYLATITTSLENALAIRAAGYNPAWLGGHRLAGTNQWQWSTDPAYNASANPMTFFYQGTATQTSLGSGNSGTGGTTATGYYSNFNAGEPNNWTGSASGDFGINAESALQFTGTLGKWNDLPQSGQTLTQYVRETSLAPSRLTLDAGTGSVAINGAIGASKALSSLDIVSSSTQVNGSALITTGAQSYSSGLTVNSSSTNPMPSVTIQGTGVSVGGALAVYGSDISINAPLTMTGANPAEFDFNASRHISLANGKDISSSSAALNILFHADTDNSGDGINIIGGSISNTHGGWVKFGNGDTASIGGVSTYVGGDVYFNGSSAQSINSGGGTIDIWGETMVGNTAGLSLTSGNANINLHGKLNSANSYTFVDKTADTSHDWDWARTDAKNGTAGGSAVGDSYLVTVTSRLENAIAGQAAGYKGAWIGAYRADPNSYAWTWANGPEAGVQFFTQVAGGGGTASSGYYANFGSGEPNGGLSTTRSAVETVGQFFGTQGYWNDLSHTVTFSSSQASQYSVLGYVRETNLAASPVTINAGSGSVLVDGAVGGGKALASLAVTSASTQINGEWLKTTGAQTYSSGLTVNSNSSMPNLTVEGAGLTAAGPIAVYGGNITVNTALTTTGSGAGILLKGSGYLMQANPNLTLQSNNGDITLWADADGNSSGWIGLREGARINTANGATNQTSGGGNITLAGGATAGGNGLPTGYAYAASGTGTWGSVVPSGVQIGAFNIGAGGSNDFRFYSGGGNILINGRAADGAPGVSWYSGAAGVTQIMDAGSGSIDINGQGIGSGHGIELNYYAVAGSVSPTIKSSSNATTAINITGSATATGAYAGYQGGVTLVASGSGGISISGTSASTSYYGFASGGVNAYAASGSIAISGVATGNTSNGLSLTGNIGSGGGIASSSSNVTITGNAVAFPAAESINTSGTVSIQPSGNDFTAAFSTTNLSLAGVVSGLTIGKSATGADGSSDANVTLTSPIGIAGPISIYGGTMVVAADVSASTASNIILSASNGFYSSSTTINSGETRRTVSSNGGDIFVSSDANADGSGVLNIDYLSFNAGAGNLTIEAPNFNWVTASATDKPYINGTGAYTLRSAGSSFTQGLATSWFNIDQDANGIGGLTLGKSSNTQAVNVDSAQTVNGPIAINGGAVTLTAALATTNTSSGDIAITTTGLSGTPGMSVASGRDLTVTQSGTSTYAGVISGSNASFTKAGGGTLTLSGASTYTGDTNINAGTLALSGSLAAATDVVMSGTSVWDLQVGQSIASLTMAAGNSVTRSSGGSSLHVTGAATLANSVTTVGSQTYDGPVHLIADTTLATTQSDITFNSTVDSVDPASPRNLTANITPGSTYYWVDWTSSDATHVYGTLTIGADVVNVTYTNPQGFFGVQTNGGTFFWTSSNAVSPYVSAQVANGPATADIVQLQYQGSQTLVFSQPIANLAFAVVSLNGNGYGFNQDFNIVAQTGVNGAGCGYWGCGAFSKTTSGASYNLNGASGEPHGTIRFSHAFSSLTWNSLANESWNGFTVGVSGTSANSGTVHFNGAAGSSAGLGAVAVNANLHTAADISGAASLAVTGLSTLGGKVTTSGDQSYQSAVTLASDVTLKTTANGSVNTTSDTSPIDGAHNLTIQTAGTGNTTLNGAVGGTTPLTGLSVTTNSLSAGAIALATNAPLSVSNSGFSAITGAITGSGVTLTKDGANVLILTGSNTYSGATTINAGSLALGDGGASGSLATSAMTNNGNFVIDRAADTSIPFAISGHGNVNVYGEQETLYSGFLTTTATTIASNTTVAEVLQRLSGARQNGVNVSGGSTAQAGIYVTQFNPLTNTATLQVQEYNSVSSPAFTKTVFVKLSQSGSNVQAKIDTSGSHTNGTAYSAGNTNIVGTDMSTGASYDMPLATSAAASGYGVDQLYAAAKTTFTGANTYTGGTFLNTSTFNVAAPNLSSQVARGTLVIGNGGALGSGGVGNAGLLVFNTSANTTASGNITGAGWLLQSGSGTTTLAGNNSYTGDTVVNAGILQMGSGGTSGSLASSSAIDLPVAGAKFAINRSDSLTLANAISGLGSVEKMGSNSVTLSANGTYSGATSIDGGSLILQNDAPTSSSSSFNGPGSLTIQPASASFTSAFSTSGWNFSSTLGGLSLGKSGNSANITVANNQTIAGPVSIYGGNIAINGRLEATGDTIKLEASGSVSDGASGYLVADSLALKGSGNFSLDATSNAVNTLAAGNDNASPIGSLTFVNSAALTIGSVNPTGITASGPVSVSTVSGNLILSENISTTDTSASAVILNAGSSASPGGSGTPASGNLIISGSPTVSVGTGGTARLFSGSLAGSSGLAALASSGAESHFRYNADETTNFASGNWLNLGAGIYVIYRQQPTVTVTANDATSTYGTTPTYGFSVNSANGETAAQIFKTLPNVAVGGTLSTSGNPIVGDHALTTSGGTDQLGYSIAGNTGGTLTVNRKPLTYTGTGNSRAYDGGLTGTVTDSASGIVSGDVVTVTSTSAVFGDKNAGNGKSMSVAGIGLSNTDSGNYSIAASATTSGDITPKTLTVTGLAADGKTYDGTSGVLVSDWGSVSTGVGAESLVLSHGLASFADANAGTGKTVTATGYALANGANGGLASNYQLASTSATTSADIAKAALTVTANNDGKFVTQSDTAGYNGVSYAGFVHGETESVLGGSLAIARSNSGVESAGTYAGVLLPGGLTAANYNISYAGGDYTIVPSSQLLIRVSNLTSTYGVAANYSIASAEYWNGSSAVSLSGITAHGNNSFTIDDGAGGQATFTLAPANAVLSSSANLAVGSYQLATSGTVTANSGNFNDTINVVGSQAVYQKGLNASASGVSKVYDGNTAMSGASVGVSGVIASDTVSASGSGAYAQKNAGSGLAYTISGLSLSGVDAGNYYLTGGGSLSGSDGVITPRTITL